MAVTREQFDKLIAEGFTPEEIASFDKRSQSTQPQTQVSPQQPQSVLQQLTQSTKNLAKEAADLPYRISAHTLQGLEGLLRGGKTRSYTNPLTGTTVEPYTSQTPLNEPVGLGLQGGAFATGSPMLGGSMFGAGMGMEAGKGGTQIAGQALLGALLGRVVGTITGQYKMPTLKSDKLAGKAVNSLIKPKHKEFLFGKNPGQGVAKEGIVATSMDDLVMKVDKRTTEINNVVKLIRNSPKNMNKNVNLSKIKQPLIDSVVELRKAPKVHSAEIKNLENALSDIGKLQGGNLKNISISEAYKIKGIIARMQKWTSESQAGVNLNKALKKVYHFVDDKIDTAIPELRKLNSRMADLISARQAINSRIEVLQRQEPANWSNLLNLPFTLYRSTVAKTTLGKILAKGYKTK
jgi:prefoldin subunit 5